MGRGFSRAAWYFCHAALFLFSRLGWGARRRCLIASALMEFFPRSLDESEARRLAKAAFDYENMGRLDRLFPEAPGREAPGAGEPSVILPASFSEEFPGLSVVLAIAKAEGGGGTVVWWERPGLFLIREERRPLPEDREKAVAMLRSIVGTNPAWFRW